MLDLTITLEDSRERVMEKLLRYGAVVVRQVFSQTMAVSLTREARRLEYQAQPKVYGSRSVRQELATARVPVGGELWQFADSVQSTLSDLLGSEAFATPLTLRHRVVQRYLPDTLGIEPHWDESCFRNLIVLCGLNGYGTFTLYPGLGLPPMQRLMLAPGSVLLMVAPGFRGNDFRPLHGVSDIRGERYILGLRQTESKEDEHA